MKYNIPYEDLKKVNHAYEAALKQAFSDMLDSGWYVLGQSVAQFEQAYAAAVGSKHCVGVANGLDAMIIALKVLQIEPGSEVIVPSNTYIATILAVMQAGLKPVLVEPRLDSYNIDPMKIAAAITPQTKAILCVHLYGSACDMNALVAIADQHNLYLLEDCAQAHGARVAGRAIGSWGIMGCHSFYPTKNLGALGDAGAVTTDDDDLAHRVRSLRNYGSSQKYHNDHIGYNSRLDEIQAAFLQIKLSHLDQAISHKRSIAKLYHEGLRSDFIRPLVQAHGEQVYHIYPIRHERRDELRAFLASQGIGTEIHYPIAPHRQEAYKNHLRGEYPISELIHNTILSLPCSTANSLQEIEQVIEVINQF